MSSKNTFYTHIIINDIIHNPWWVRNNVDGINIEYLNYIFPDFVFEYDFSISIKLCPLIEEFIIELLISSFKIIKVIYKIIVIFLTVKFNSKTSAVNYWNSCICIFRKLSDFLYLLISYLNSNSVTKNNYIKVIWIAVCFTAYVNYISDLVCLA